MKIIIPKSTALFGIYSALQGVLQEFICFLETHFRKREADLFIIGWGISCVNAVNFLFCLFVIILPGKQEDLANFLVGARKHPKTWNYKLMESVT